MCSIFGVKTHDELLVGRNFDWLIKGGNIHFKTSYRSYGIQTYGFCMIEQMGEDRPYEGLNEKGLFIGMAAVVNSPLNEQPFEYMNNLGVMRFILERASNVQEALTIIKGFRLNYMQDNKYPKVHYLIADQTGSIATYEEGVHEKVWVLGQDEGVAMTNFAIHDPLPCDRLEAINTALIDHKIKDVDSAKYVLQQAKQESTIWSSVYNVVKKQLTICIEQHYDHCFTFDLDEELRKGNHSIDFGTLKLEGEFY